MVTSRAEASHVNVTWRFMYDQRRRVLTAQVLSNQLGLGLKNTVAASPMLSFPF